MNVRLLKAKRVERNVKQKDLALYSVLPRRPCVKKNVVK